MRYESWLVTARMPWAASALANAGAAPRFSSGSRHWLGVLVKI